MARGARWRRGARGGAWSFMATALLVGLTVASAPPVGAAGADWPQFRGGADHRGWNRNETTISAANVARLHPAWIASVLQYPPVEPVVAGNRLYVASYNEATFQLTMPPGMTPQFTSERPNIASSAAMAMSQAQTWVKAPPKQ